MALAMQQALALLPTERQVAHQLAQQPWWRPDVILVAKYYLGDQTWDLFLAHHGHLYSVVYDARDGRCDAIEPLPCDLSGTFRYTQEG